MEIRIGSRGSRLALVQTDMVCSQIKKLRPDVETNIEIIKTVGDKVLDRPIAEVGGKGVFVDSIEDALRKGEIQFAVHSGKDIPSVISDEFALKAILPRADDRDVLLLRKDVLDRLDDSELIIGTSSPRRKELLKRAFPLSQDKLLRGNVPTRVDKLRQGEYDGIILAAAGLNRLGLDTSDLEVRYLDTASFIPATNQGIIVCEALKGTEAAQLLEELADTEELRILNIILKLERAISSYMDADCYDAAAVNAVYTGNGKLLVKWFYGASEIEQQELSMEDAENIILGRSTEWKKKIEEYVS